MNTQFDFRDYRYITYIVFGIGIILLMSLLSYPHGLDQQIFTLYGDIIRHGGIPYRDAIEIKPPLVYYMYAFSEYIFGNNELSIRIFEVAYQLLTSYLLFRLTLKTTGSKSFALGTYITYIVMLVMQGYWETAQAETFSALPGIILFWSLIKADEESSPKVLLLYALTAGASLASYCWFKYNFIVILPVIVIFILSGSVSRQKYSATLVILSFLMFYLSYVLYLYLNGAMKTYLEVMFEWAPGYAGLNPLLSRKTLSEIIWLNFPVFLFYNYTGLLTISMIAGIIYILHTYKLFLVNNNTPRSRASLLLLLLLASLFFSLILERKLFVYHYNRAIWAAAPLIVIGLWKIYQLIVIYWKRRETDTLLFTIPSRIIILGVLSLFSFYSPIMKLKDSSIEFGTAALGGENPKQHLIKLKPDDYFAGEFEIADSLRPNLNETDNIFIWGTHIGVYDILSKRPPAKMITTMQMVAPFTPKSWRKEIIERLYKTKPKFILIQMNDVIPFITGSNLDSYGNYTQFDDLLYFVGDYYTLRFETLMYVVYERTSDIPDSAQTAF